MNKSSDVFYAVKSYIYSIISCEKLPKEIFRYIEDNVKEMDYIIRQLQMRTDIKEIFDYQ